MTIDDRTLLSRRKFLRRVLGGTLGAGLATAGSLAYGTQVEPAAYEVTHITIPLRNLPAAFDGFSVVQVSDWHLGDWMTIDRLLPAIRQVNDLQPDVTVMTGDFISGDYQDQFSAIIQALASINGPVYATFGNHDFWTDPQGVARAIDQTNNARMLRNANVVIERAGTSLYLAGVDDIWEHKNDLGKALDGIPTDAPVILLAHEPDYADNVASAVPGRSLLQLSGHTHGGQFRLPGIGAPVLPALGQKYDAGLFNINGLNLYVNRGLGMVRPYVRFGSRPEITQITLRGA